MLRCYIVISLIDFIIVPIRIYVIKDIKDPFSLHSGKCFIQIGVLFVAQFASFIAIKYSNGRLQKLICIVCLLIIALLQFEIISEVESNQLLTYLHIFILYPLICALINEINLNSRASYLLEGSIAIYLILRAIIFKYGEKKEFPIGSSLTYIYTFALLMFQHTYNHNEQSRSNDKCVKNLQTVLFLNSFWMSKIQF